MTVNNMREAISSVYGPAWKYRVDKMADNQVIAIYHKFLKDGKLDKQKRSYAKQLSMFD